MVLKLVNPEACTEAKEIISIRMVEEDKPFSLFAVLVSAL